MTKESSISAQDLLKERNISFQGYLEQKVSSIGSKKWNKTFVIILNGSIYMFSDMNSKKPKMVAVLSAYSQLSVSTDLKKPSRWNLILKSNSTKHNIQDIQFRDNMEEKKINIVNVLNVYIPQEDSNSICQSLSRHSLDLSMRIQNGFDNDSEHNYDSAENPSQNSFRSKSSYLPELPNHNQITKLSNNISMESDYEETDNKSIASETDLNRRCSITDLRTYVDTAHNEENYLFRGTSSEAYLELQKNIVHESFLVRQDVDNRRVLTVQCRNEVVKYNLDIDPETNNIKIRNQNKMFFNLDGLINYYRENIIPGSFCKLGIPYKLK